MSHRSLYIGLKDRKKIDKLWEQVYSNGIPPGSIADPYRSMLLRDWKRCIKMGIDLDMQKALLLPEEDYEEIKKDKEFLLYTAMPILEKARHFLTGVSGILILTDDMGTILYITGDSLVRSKAAEDSNLIEGSRWNESVTGTNGIGTALAKATSVHVYASEHFCRGWHQWTCAASPILNPFTREPIGVVDLTTLVTDYREEAVRLTYSLATHITTEIALQLELERMNLIQKYEFYSTRYPSDRIVVLDRMGHVVRSNTEVDPAEYKAYVADKSSALHKEIRPMYLSGTQKMIGTLLIDRQEDIIWTLKTANRQLMRISQTISQYREGVLLGEHPSFASIDRKDRLVNYTLEAVAHEIRNPLTAVGGLARRLADSLDPQSHSGKYAKAIMDEALRLEKVLSEMLEQSLHPASLPS